MQCSVVVDGDRSRLSQSEAFRPVSIVFLWSFWHEPRAKYRGGAKIYLRVPSAHFHFELSRVRAILALELARVSVR